MDGVRFRLERPSYGSPGVPEELGYPVILQEDRAQSEGLEGVPCLQLITLWIASGGPSGHRMFSKFDPG